MSINPMQEKCECGHPKHAHYFGDATMNTPCGVCSCQNFKFPAPALSDEEIREDLGKRLFTIAVKHTGEWWTKKWDKLSEDGKEEWRKDADQILSLTASHYTEKIKELGEAAREWRKTWLAEYKRANELESELSAKLHQAEQETARELIEFIKWLRDEEAISPEDWDKHCEEKWQELESKYEVSK